MKRSTLEFRTEFTVAGASNVRNAARDAAAAFDAVAEAGKRVSAGQEAMSNASRAAVAGQKAVAEELARIMREIAGSQAGAADAAKDAAGKTVKAAEEMAKGVGNATSKAKAHYDEVAKAAAAAVRAAEDASRGRIRDEEDTTALDSEGRLERIADKKKERDALLAQRRGMAAPKHGASRAVQQSYDAEAAALDARIAAAEEKVRRSEIYHRDMTRFEKRLMEDLLRSEAEKLRAVRDSEEQKTAAAKKRVDEERRLEAETVLAAKKAADEKIAAAAAVAKAREKEAQAQVRRNERELGALSKAAQKAFERSQEKRDNSADVEAGMRNPAKLRTDAAAAVAKFAERAAKAAARAQEAQDKLAAFEGTTEAKKKLTSSENRSLGQFNSQAAKAEAESRRLAEVLKEVEKRLAATAAEATKAAAAIDGVLASAVKRQGALADKKALQRDMAVGIADPRRAKASADLFAKAYEDALARVVKAAQQAKAAIAVATALSADNADEINRVKAEAGARVAAAQAAAERIGAAARRTAAVSEEVSRRQAKAAAAAGRANEQAAKRAAAAWEASQARLVRIQRTLPSLLGNRPGGLWYRMQADGSLSMVGALFGKLSGVIGTVFSVAGAAGRIAFGALSGVVGVLGSIVGAAGNAAAGVLGLGVSAVAAAGRFGVYLGTSALSVLGKLGGAAVDAAGKVAGIARNIVIKASVVAGGAAVAGYAGAKKAVSDSAAASKETYDGMLASGTGINSFQAMGAAAKRSGVDMQDFATATQAARENMRSLTDNPELLKYFNYLRVGTSDFYGRVRDTNQVLTELIQRSTQMAPVDRLDMFSRLFGSYENMEKVLPLVRQLMSPNDGFMALASLRQQQLGAWIMPSDVYRMRTFNAVTNDLADAWKGLKLTVSRAVGDDVLRGMNNLATFIGKHRGQVGQFARVWFDVGLAMKEVVLRGRDMSAEVREGLWGASALRGLLKATLLVRTLGVEAWEVTKAFRQAERTGKAGEVFASAPVYNTVKALFVLKNAAVATAPFFREFWAAATGQDAKVVRFGWMLDVRRTAGDMWRTIRGRDDDVAPNHQWMITLREGLFTTGRFAREAWAAIRGRTEQVDEFPVLLKIRDRVQGTFQWVKDFTREAWLAVTGEQAGVVQRFPWMQETRLRVTEFVTAMRAQWADLQAVWAGGDPTTALGERLANVLSTVTYYKEQASKVWEDLKHVFSGEIGADVAFNFPGIKEAAQDFEAIKERVTKAYEVFKVLFDYVDNTIQRFTFGKVDLATVALVTGFLTLFGVVRVAMGGFILMRGAAGLLARALGRTTAAAGGAGGAAAAGGLAGALTRTGRAAEEAGRRATSSAGAWGTLVGKFRNLGSYLAGNPALLALLGLGGSIAGGMISDSSTSLGGKMLGGALQGAGTGAMIGSVAGPWGAGIGAAVGGAYGAFAGRSEYNRQNHDQLLDDELRRQGRGDLADQRAAARAKAAATETDEDDDTDEAPARGRGGDPTAMRPYTPQYADESRYPEARALGEADQERALAAGMERLAEQMRQFGTMAPAAPAAAEPRVPTSVPKADINAVREAMERVRRGTDPSQADYVRGVIGGVPPADAYTNSTSRQLYLNSPYSKSPMAAPPPSAPAAAPAGAGNVTMIFGDQKVTLTGDEENLGKLRRQREAALARPEWSWS
ncbi:hypothetical protein ACUXK4_004536 [Methylorubrum extorquens]